tara:strand:- start:1226 stop:1765 length:540 start_codon:yes stop_codon:yes gene_type:complete
MDVKVYDNVVDHNTLRTITQYLSSAFYSLTDGVDTTFDNVNPMASDGKFWRRIHKGDSLCDSNDEQLSTVLYEALSKVCKVPPYNTVRRVYTDLIRFGDRPRSRVEDVGSNNRTIIFYTNDQWHRDWGGETVFYEGDEIFKSVLPRPGRIVSFDGRIPHSGRPPVTPAHRPRYITVMKF